MSCWKNIEISKNNVQADSGRAILIAFPHSSEFDGFCFWHPSKLVRTGRNSNSLSVGYTDDFQFRILKYGKGKYNSKEIISEMEIGVLDFEEAFRTMNENIFGKKFKNPYETHKPGIVPPDENIEALKELKDDE